MAIPNLSIKANQITYSPELPPADKYTAEENTMVAVPAKEKGKFSIYTRYEGKWVYTCAFNGSDFEAFKDYEQGFASKV